MRPSRRPLHTHAPSAIALPLLSVARRSTRRIAGGGLSRGACPPWAHDSPADVRNQAATRSRRAELRERLRASGVRWHGLRYHKRPSLPATTFDTMCGALACMWLVRRHKLGAVHARNHVPAAMAMIAAPFAPHRLIFDIRGLMAEEYVDLGRWRSGGLAFRITKRTERAAIRRATGVVVLTHRVRRLLLGAGNRHDVVVIPCCADIERLSSQRASRTDVRRTLGSELDRSSPTWGSWAAGTWMPRWSISSSRHEMPSRGCISC